MNEHPLISRKNTIKANLQLHASRQSHFFIAIGDGDTNLLTCVYETIAKSSNDQVETI